MYVIQDRFRSWEKWELRYSLGKFKTLEEAKVAFGKLSESEKEQSRIAEEYTVTVTRYKAIKKVAV